MLKNNRCHSPFTLWSRVGNAVDEAWYFQSFLCEETHNFLPSFIETSAFSVSIIREISVSIIRDNFGPANCGNPKTPWDLWVSHDFGRSLCWWSHRPLFFSLLPLLPSSSTPSLYLLSPSALLPLPLSCPFPPPLIPLPILPPLLPPFHLHLYLRWN